MGRPENGLRTKNPSGGTNIYWWDKLLEAKPPEYMEWLSREKGFLRSTIAKGAKVLVVGCGNGREMKDIAPGAGEVVGLDIDDVAVKTAASSTRAFGNTSVVQADARLMPFESGTFDNVICVGATFGNFGGQKGGILKEMGRVLRPGGAIVLSVYSEESLPVRLRVYGELGVDISRVSRTGTTVWLDHSNIISEKFDEDRVRRFANSAGLEISEVARFRIGTAYTLVHKADGGRPDKTSEHYSVEKYERLVERTKNEAFRNYMAAEAVAITTGIQNPGSKTFIDLGAGYGRILPLVAANGRNVFSIELNPEMFAELERRSNSSGNCKAILGDMVNFPRLLEGQNVDRPVVMILQNTLSLIKDYVGLLEKIRDFASRNKGEVIISVSKQEALEGMGIKFYESMAEMVGQPDFEKTDFVRGLFVSKTGYEVKWWTPEQRQKIREVLGGRIVRQYEGPNFYILHVSYTDG